MVKRNPLGLETDLLQRAHPDLAWEQSLDVPIVLHTGGPVLAAKEIGKISRVRRVRGIRIRRPLQIAQPPPFSS